MKLIRQGKLQFPRLRVGLATRSDNPSHPLETCGRPFRRGRETRAEPVLPPPLIQVLRLLFQEFTTIHLAGTPCGNSCSDCAPRRKSDTARAILIHLLAAANQAIFMNRERRITQHISVNYSSFATKLSKSAGPPAYPQARGGP